MAWTYRQSDGHLSDNRGALVATGYSGIGHGLNNHGDQDIPNVGPIPVGSYTIGPAFSHPQCGPISMRLDPMPGTDTKGRTGFLVHGDSASQDHTASHGCVILAPLYRRILAATPDRILMVMP